MNFDKLKGIEISGETFFVIYVCENQQNCRKINILRLEPFPF